MIERRNAKLLKGVSNAAKVFGAFCFFGAAFLVMAEDESGRGLGRMIAYAIGFSVLLLMALAFCLISGDWKIFRDTKRRMQERGEKRVRKIRKLPETESDIFTELAVIAACLLFSGIFVERVWSGVQIGEFGWGWLGFPTVGAFIGLGAAARELMSRRNELQ